MDIIQHLKTDFNDRIVPGIEENNQLEKLIKLERSFIDSLTPEQLKNYNELKILEDSKSIHETNDALEFGFKYAVNIIKKLITN